MLLAVFSRLADAVPPRRQPLLRSDEPPLRPTADGEGFGAPKKGSRFGAPKKAAAKSKIVFEGQKTFDKHLKLFKSLEDPEDRSNMCDCYVRAEGNDKFWFAWPRRSRRRAAATTPRSRW